MMKYKTLIIIICVTLICTSVILLNYLSINRTAIYSGERLNWKGNVYIPAAGDYNESKTIAKTSDGKWQINSIKGDTLNNYVVVRSFLDQYLFVRQDYDVPKSGVVTAIYVGGYKMTDYEFCNAISEIMLDDGDIFYFETNNIYQYFKKISISYNDCPVGTVNAGFIGKKDGKWIYVEPFETFIRSDDGSPKLYSVKCRVIKEKYYKIIQKYPYYLDN